MIGRSPAARRHVAIPIAAVAALFTGPATGATGPEVFTQWCSACHAAGPGHPGTQALDARYSGARPAELERRTDLTPELVRYFVRHGVSVMPFFRKTEISDEDLDALAAWLARSDH